jgi:hypothetical protein
VHGIFPRRELADVLSTGLSTERATLTCAVSPSAASFRLRPSTILEESAAWLTISQSPTPDEWLTIGPLLLNALHSLAASRLAAQMIVVTAHLDEPKRAALKSRGLTIASEWWVGSID